MHRSEIAVYDNSSQTIVSILFHTNKDEVRVKAGDIGC